MKRVISILIATVVALAIVVAVSRQRAPGVPAGPQAVFLIVVDTLRPDRLSCYGFKAHKTLHIDRLARSGVRFANAQSTASWTVPSMGSVLTGRYPSELGLVEQPAPPGKRFAAREQRAQLSFTISPSESTLAERLSAAGYRTAAFVNQPALNAQEGFAQGFHDWFAPAGSGEIRRRDPTAPFGDDAGGAASDQAAWKNQDRVDAGLVSSFESWLETHSSERMFVWLHLLSPHRPYNPPRAYRQVRGRAPSTLYNGEVRYIDDLVARVTSAIDSTVGRDHAVIVFTSDHGEEFGEHGMIEHGHSLHREVTWVPLIVVAPGLQSGGVVSDYVSLLDIMPTILELTDNPLTTTDHRGRGLFYTLYDTPSARSLYLEGMLYGSTERALIDRGYKLMLDAQAPAKLYEVHSDRQEKNSLAREDTARVRAMTTELLAMLEDLEKSRLQEPLSDSLASDEELERVRRAMRALGYVD